MARMAVWPASPMIAVTPSARTSVAFSGTLAIISTRAIQVNGANRSESEAAPVPRFNAESARTMTKKTGQSRSSERKRRNVATAATATAANKGAIATTSHQVKLNR
jgi:hypothetical protein